MQSTNDNTYALCFNEYCKVLWRFEEWWSDILKLQLSDNPLVPMVPDTKEFTVQYKVQEFFYSLPELSIKNFYTRNHYEWYSFPWFIKPTRWKAMTGKIIIISVEEFIDIITQGKWAMHVTSRSKMTKQGKAVNGNDDSLLKELKDKLQLCKTNNQDCAVGVLHQSFNFHALVNLPILTLMNYFLLPGVQLYNEQAEL